MIENGDMEGDKGKEFVDELTVGGMVFLVFFIYLFICPCCVYEGLLALLLVLCVFPSSSKTVIKVGHFVAKARKVPLASSRMQGKY